MFEVEKFMSDEEMNEQVAEAEQQLESVKALSKRLKVRQSFLAADTEKLFKLSPLASSTLCYFKSPADLVVYTILYANHKNPNPNVLSDILGSLKDKAVNNGEEQVKKWHEIIVDLIGEHPNKENAIKQLDYLAEALLAPK
jgi:hypothetical protein